MWWDGLWWTCDGYGLIVIDPASGQDTRPGQECSTIAEVQGQLAVLPSVGSAWRFFAASQGVFNNAYVSQYKPWPTFLSNGTSAQELHGIYYSGDHLEVIDTVTDTATELPLDGFDTVVRGVSHHNGAVRVLDDGRADGANWVIKLRDFDPQSGASTSVLDVGTRGVDFYRGLWCGTPL